MREYRNRICSAVLAAVCVIGTALIPSRAVHAEDVVDCRITIHVLQLNN
ncbi:MAG: hypothetical protein V8S75_06780 [[Ruminococcus] torques]